MDNSYKNPAKQDNTLFCGDSVYSLPCQRSEGMDVAK